MLDFSVAKLALIGSVALMVIGPQRLPAVARFAGRLLGRLQGYMKSLKDEVNQQLLTESLEEEKKALLASTEVIRTVADDMAEAEQDYSAAIANANRSFEMLDQSEPVLPALSDADARRKQRLFQQKKQRHRAGPPVWYQRTSGKKSRFISGGVRKQSRPDAAANRFFS